MKHYVSSFKLGRGMAVAGPFNTRDEADAWVSALTPEQQKEYPCCQLTCGPDELGPDWPNNLREWKKLK